MPDKIPELPERFKKANSDDLMEDIDKGLAVQKKTAELLRKNPIDLKKYKGRVHKIDFTEEEKKEK